ncbi:MAG: hypothetical protein KJ901_15375 [Gammaproteobacteria bacterium]|nr:hypothetical protein [Gammaproteobacteria bacterium]MBU1440295.1 hypothetical protein [Gammaproteobacteria bacterium]
MTRVRRAQSFGEACGMDDDRRTNLRPLRDLVAHLPHLPLGSSDTIDFPAATPRLLHTIADNADTTLSTIHSGLGAIGHLLAHSAVVIEDGTVGADSLESLGFLMAELGDLAAACLVLSGECRRAAAGAASGFGGDVTAAAATDAIRGC